MIVDAKSGSPVGGAMVAAEHWSHEPFAHECKAVTADSAGLFTGPCGEENDGRRPQVGILANRPQELEAVHTGHHDVGEDEIRLPGAHELER